MQEELEDTKGVIRIHKSKKISQHNGQKDMNPTKIGDEDRRSRRENSSRSTSGIRRVNPATNPAISHE
jgi:hypothetical protein